MEMNREQAIKYVRELVYDIILDECGLCDNFMCPYQTKECFCDNTFCRAETEKMVDKFMKILLNKG